METLLLRLLLHGTWREAYGKILTTEEYLYAQRRRGVFRLPLAACNQRLAKGDGAHLFGRHNLVILPTREQPCPVRAHLDEVLLRSGGKTSG